MNIENITGNSLQLSSILGRVVSLQPQLGVNGLRVEAWDNGLIYENVVSVAITNEQGEFQMALNEFYLTQIFADRKPELFFKVFRENKLIKDTQNSVVWDPDRQNDEMVIEVDESATEKTEVGLDIATRSLLQATYTPIESREEELRILKRGLEKGSFIARLRPSQRELEQLADQYKKDLPLPELKDTSSIEKILKGIEIIGPTIPKSGRINVLRSAKQFTDIEVHTLILVGESLIKLREEELDATMEAHKTIQEHFNKALVTVETSSLPKPTVKALMDWAIENDIRKDVALKTLELAERLSLRSDKIMPTQFSALASQEIDRMRILLDGFRDTTEVMPVGYLHLERLCFIPAGIEQGELVYSVPLAPREEVNITHREWSHTSEEFERIVTDYLEEFSEEGVTEKSELAESVNSQNQHSTAFNTGVTASGSYGPVSITATVGYNVSDSASKSEQLSRNQSIDITHKASSRSKKEHKMSFKVASAIETEDQTVRRIRNPYHDKVTRVDYYQLIRKWQVDLYRYGVRLTYDIVIPEPGTGLLSKILEITQLKTLLEQGYEFPLTPDEISLDPDSEDFYTKKAEEFGVSITQFPPDLEMTVSDAVEVECQEDFTRRMIRIDKVPEDYVVKATHLGARFEPNRNRNWVIWIHDMTGTLKGIFYTKKEDNPDWNGWAVIEDPYENWKNKTGTLILRVGLWAMLFGAVSYELELVLKDNVQKAWKLKLWEMIRESHHMNFLENKNNIRERLARLEEELGAQDALSLRKKEREEVMKGILRWLGIPEFQFYLPGLPEELYEEETGLVKEEINEALILAHGEKIKFLHHAIEWENMLYFLYPYFWSPTDWEFKKYLDHPDPMHRAFLKAGSARVVLTIRPGFEKAFLGFVETGELGQLPEPPYLTIGEEFENYAKTNYPGIPPANPVKNARCLLYPKQKKAWEDMQCIMDLLEKYFAANDQIYPSTAQGLAALQPYTDPEIPTVPTQDPWGNNYVYTCPGLHGKYDLVSFGADGVPGGEDENADITNWAEASLIGRWYEYTPTSALDIAFDEEMPTA